MADILSALQYANAPEDTSLGVPNQNPNASFHLTPDAQARLSSYQPSAPGKIDILAAMQNAADDTPPPPPPAPTFGQSVAHGAGDIFYGLGRMAQHAIPDPVLNGIRSAVGWNPVSTAQWDQLATQREQQYDQARAAAGQNGIDWGRLTGNVFNPVNYLTPGGPAESVLGRIGQAVGQGTALGAVQGGQTSTAPGHYWWDTAKGALTGGLTGGALSGALETLSPLLSYATNKVRSIVNDNPQTSSVAADTVVKNVLQQQGVDPNQIDLNLLKGMRQDVQSALDHGADVSPQSIVNRAKAESLPVPIQLTRGQATGDPMLFAREQNLRGVTGVGEPITQRLQDQNNGFIQNLDLLGAKNAMDPVSFGANLKENIQNYWNGLQEAKNNLYAQVKNNAGQSSAMDGISAADTIKGTLNTPEQSYAYKNLPANIQATIDDLGSGKMPFNVAQMQQLDKLWGQQAAGASDGSVRYAINQARNILNNAPIIDDTGEAAKQAYMAARNAHAQQMSLVSPKLPNGLPNPNYQPIVDSVVYKDAPSENLFKTYFMNSAPSEAQQHLNFLQQNVDPNIGQNVSNTLMGEIKRQALNSTSDERGTVSENEIRQWANDPVKSARLQTLLPDSAYNTFKNLADTITAAKKAPVASAVNTSNTASGLTNIGLSMLKNAPLTAFVSKLPLAKSIAEGYATAKTQSQVQQALNPGVTLQSLMTSTPQQAFAKRLATQVLLPAAVTSQEVGNGSNQ